MITELRRQLAQAKARATELRKRLAQAEARIITVGLIWNYAVSSALTGRMS